MNPAVVAGFVLAILIEIALPFALGFWAEAKLDVAWRLFAYGALVFAVTQLLLRLPLVSLLGRQLNITTESGAPLVLSWTAFLAATAALAEEGGRYLGYRFLFRGQPRDWNNAIMYGLGHGALESVILVGLPTALTLANILTIPGLDPTTMGLTTEQAQQLARAKEEIGALQFWMPLAGAFERLLMLFFQTAMAVLVVQVFARQEWRWLGYALGLRFLVELVSPLTANYGSVVLAEGFLAVVTAVVVYWGWKLRPRPQPQESDRRSRRRRAKGGMRREKRNA